MKVISLKKPDQYLSVVNADELIKEIFVYLKRGRKDDIEWFMNLNIRVVLYDFGNKWELSILKFGDSVPQDCTIYTVMELNREFTVHTIVQAKLAELRPVMRDKIRGNYEKLIQQTPDLLNTLKEYKGVKTEDVKRIPKTKIVVNVKNEGGKFSKKFDATLQGLIGDDIRRVPLAKLNSVVKIDSKNLKVSIDGNIYNLKGEELFVLDVPKRYADVASVEKEVVNLHEATKQFGDFIAQDASKIQVVITTNGKARHYDGEDVYDSSKNLQQRIVKGLYTTLVATYYYDDDNLKNKDEIEITNKGKDFEVEMRMFND